MLVYKILFVSVTIIFLTVLIRELIEVLLLILVPTDKDIDLYRMKLLKKIDNLIVELVTGRIFVRLAQKRLKKDISIIEENQRSTLKLVKQQILDFKEQRIKVLLKSNNGTKEIIMPRSKLTTIIETPPYLDTEHYSIDRLMLSETNTVRFRFKYYIDEYTALYEKNYKFIGQKETFNGQFEDFFNSSIANRFDLKTKEDVLNFIPFDFFKYDQYGHTTSFIGERIKVYLLFKYSHNDVDRRIELENNIRIRDQIPLKESLPYLALAFYYRKYGDFGDSTPISEEYFTAFTICAKRKIIPDPYFMEAGL